jgi:hypothetical protein
MEQNLRLGIERKGSMKNQKSRDRLGPDSLLAILTFGAGKNRRQESDPLGADCDVNPIRVPRPMITACPQPHGRMSRVPLDGDGLSSGEMRAAQARPEGHLPYLLSS